MSGWRIISTSLMIGGVLGALYLTAAVRRFGFVKLLSRGKKPLGWLISAAVIGAVFGLVTLTMSYINGVIVLLHAVLFFLLSGLVMRIVKAVRRKETRLYWQGILAVSGTVICLAAGYYLCHRVKQTDYSLTTAKELGTLKIALFADSHMGSTFDGEGFARHMETIAQQQPDIVIIAGDFIDSASDTETVRAACRALGDMDVKYGVWFTYGNHDSGRRRGAEFPEGSLEAELEACGVHVLADEVELIDGRFYLIGRKDASDKSRAPMAELTAGLDGSKFMIVSDHQPNDYDNEAAAGVDLVLSGHTHGGQLFPATFAGEWFGMNDSTYGYERRGDTDFIVTSGISDWNIQFKTGTSSEYVVITVNGQ